MSRSWERSEEQPSEETGDTGLEAQRLQEGAIAHSGPQCLQSPHQLNHAEKRVGQVVAHSRAKDHAEEDPRVVRHDSQHHEVAYDHLNNMD